MLGASEVVGESKKRGVCAFFWGRRGERDRESKFVKLGLWFRVGLEMQCKWANGDKVQLG